MYSTFRTKKKSVSHKDKIPFFPSLFFHEIIEAYSGSKEFNTEFLHDWPTQASTLNGPFFDVASMPANVTGLVGKTVYLVCKVKNLGNRTVSWVSKKKDIK